MTTFRKLGICIALWTITTAFSCNLPQFGGPPPPLGTHDVSVPHYYQEFLWWCVPATVKMWVDQYGPTGVSQTAIWTWMQNNYPGHTIAGPGGGASYTAATAAAATFTGKPLVFAQYSYQQRQQAVADQQVGIKNGNPTLVLINNGGHAVLFKGANWTRLQDALQRPSDDYVKIHDPWPGYNPQTQSTGGANIIVSVGYWMNFAIRNPACGNCIGSIQMTGQYFSGQAGLQGFDLDGGRYSGPTPQAPAGRYMLDGNGACYFEPNDDGANQCTPAGPGAANTLSPGQRLYPWQSIWSSNGAYQLVFQSDGNLVLYGSGPLWASMTTGSGYAEMQTDGNLVIYNDGVAVWHSATYGNPGGWLRVENDGRIVIYNSSGFPMLSAPW